MYSELINIIKQLKQIKDMKLLKNAALPILLSTILVFGGFSYLVTPSKALAAPICGAGINLLENPDFETPLVTNPDKWDTFASGTPTLGWNVDWVSNDPSTYHGKSRPAIALLELQQNGHLGYTANSGQQWAELDSDWFGPTAPSDDEPASVKIFQDIDTIPGNTYHLSFAFSPRPDAPSADQNVLQIRWDNKTVDTISAESTSNQNQWVNHAYSFTATASSTRLEFSDQGISNSVGTYLDSTVLTCDDQIVVGGNATSTLTVIKNVINDNGGTAQASDFEINVTGMNLSTSTFQGSATGTVVILDPGVYTADELSSSFVKGSTTIDYVKNLSSDCSGSIALGENKICTITNNDMATSTNGGGGNNGGGGSNGGGSSHVVGGGRSGNGGGQVLGTTTADITSPITCSPTIQTGLINQPITFNATGGDGKYNWIIDPHYNLNLISTTTTSFVFSGSFPAAGSYTINLEGDNDTASCEAVIKAGSVLGTSDFPGMPTTGGGGNAFVSLGLALIALFSLFESLRFLSKKIELK